MNTHLGLNRSPWLTRHELPCIPSPTTLRALLSLLRCPPSAAGFRRSRSPVWTSPLMRRLAATYGRNVFALLRTASSPRVALHPASRRRSYLWLSGVGISRERTCTSQIAPAPRRTHSGESRNPAPPPAFGLFEHRVLTLKSDKRYFNINYAQFRTPACAGVTCSLAIIPRLELC